MRVLVTGAAGFIGYHLARRLHDEGHAVVVLDCPNVWRHAIQQERWSRLPSAVEKLNFNIRQHGSLHIDADVVVHLAALPGIAGSLQDPASYIMTNVLGFQNIIEEAHHVGAKHFIYASTSSVYGPGARNPYAATKMANENLAYSFWHNYGLPVTGLRFFTVYGKLSRPDMAFAQFVDRITKGEQINVTPHARAFTYIDDAVETLSRLINRPVPRTPQIHDVGCTQTRSVMEFAGHIAKTLGKVSNANINLIPGKPYEAEETFASGLSLANAIDYAPHTTIEEGIARALAL